MIKFILMAVVLLTTELKSFAQSNRTDNSENKGIRFEQDLSWEQIKAKAKGENKYIFIDVYATWCGPCKMMDRDVYPNDIVGAVVNDQFISVKIQMDRTAYDNELVKRRYADARSLVIPVISSLLLMGNWCLRILVIKDLLILSIWYKKLLIRTHWNITHD